MVLKNHFFKSLPPKNHSAEFAKQARPKEILFYKKTYSPLIN